MSKRNAGLELWNSIKKRTAFTLSRLTLAPSPPNPMNRRRWCLEPSGCWCSAKEQTDERFSESRRVESIGTCRNVVLRLTDSNADCFERRIPPSASEQGTARGGSAAEGNGNAAGSQAGDEPKVVFLLRQPVWPLHSSP